MTGFWCLITGSDGAHNRYNRLLVGGVYPSEASENAPPCYTCYTCYNLLYLLWGGHNSSKAAATASGSVPPRSTGIAHLVATRVGDSRLFAITVQLLYGAIAH